MESTKRNRSPADTTPSRIPDLFAGQSVRVLVTAAAGVAALRRKRQRDRR